MIPKLLNVKNSPTLLKTYLKIKAGESKLLELHIWLTCSKNRGQRIPIDECNCQKMTELKIKTQFQNASRQKNTKYIQKKIENKQSGRQKRSLTAKAFRDREIKPIEANTGVHDAYTFICI